MSKCVVIFSGGMDSTVLLHYCLTKFDEVYCLTYNYNQRHKIEIDRALDYTTDIGVGEGQKIQQHVVVDLGFYAQLANSSALTNPDIAVPHMKDVIGHPQNAAHVPNRNMTMLSIAAAYAESIGAGDVYYGAAMIDDISGHWDGTKEFLNMLNTTLALNRKGAVRVSAPLMVKSKSEIIKWGIELGANLGKTHTCYNGEEVACSTCPACSSRLQGFIEAKLIDPVPYAKDIPWQAYQCQPIMS
jgi:7-cyano-7-deazaguanine synthase